MAKLKPSFTKGFTYSHGRDTRILKIKTETNFVYRMVGDTVIVAQKTCRYPKLVGKFLYQKEFFCYCDLMYKSMTPTQRLRWIQYYRDTKGKYHPFKPFKTKMKSFIHKKKRWGYHNFALWVYLMYRDSMGEFFYDYLGARFLMTDAEKQDSKVKVKGAIVHKDFIKLIEELHGEEVRRLPRG